MSTCFVIVFVLGLCVASHSIPEIDFSDSVSKSEIEFGKNVNSYEDSNERGSEEETYLRNFKSLHNSTDLQALASEVQRSEEQVTPEAGEPYSIESRSDSNTRVLRGTHHDLDSLPTLDLPLFTPYKHSKIDTADLSDCARQGEWKPIGVPSNHYVHLAEDHQKEHFHSLAEDHDTSSYGTHHSPLAAEGLAVWNQFMKESNGGKHILQNEKYPKKHHHKSPPRYNQHSQHRIRPHPPPAPHVPAHPVQDFDIFQSLRKPIDDGDSNLFKIQEKPLYQENEQHPQNLIINPPNFGDLDFALLGNSYDNAQPLLQQSAGLHHQEPVPRPQHHNENFLSPPPAPSRYHQHKPPPPPLSLQKQRPKYNNKPHKPQHHRVKGHGPRRPPPPVIENPDEPIHGGSFPQLTPAESSTFTCGHNHVKGTNYHTASYQVEGESDPSLLEEEVTGTNHLHAPIIVGQPSIDHSLFNGFDDIENNRFPKQHIEEGPDLDEEGTETGSSDDEEIAKQVGKLSPFHQQNHHTNPPEASTQSSTLETTAPQVFHNEPQPLKQTLIKQGRPSKAISHYADDHTHGQGFDIGFDHSGFAEVQVNSYNSPPPLQQVGESERFSVSHPPPSADFQKGNIKVQVGSHSDPFFSSQFPPFSEANFNQAAFSKPSERSPSRNSPSFPVKNNFQFSNNQPTSFTDFSVGQFKSGPKGKYQKESVAVFDHGPPHNKTKVHIYPKKKRPHKHYEVSENGGEMIPIGKLFPPRKMPKQFDLRTPNLAVPKGKRPPPPPPPKYQSTVHLDNGNLGIYQSHPRNKVAKIRLKPKHNRGSTRFSEPDFRRSLTIKSLIH